MPAAGVKRERPRKKQKRLFRAALFFAYACAARSWASLRAPLDQNGGQIPLDLLRALPFSKIAPTA